MCLFSFSSFRTAIFYHLKCGEIQLNLYQSATASVLHYWEYTVLSLLEHFNRIPSKIFKPNWMFCWTLIELLYTTFVKMPNVETAGKLTCAFILFIVHCQNILLLTVMSLLLTSGAAKLRKLQCWITYTVYYCESFILFDLSLSCLRKCYTNNDLLFPAS